MPFLKIEQLLHKELLPGFNAHLLHTDRMTIGHIKIEEGAVLPEHHHEHEQVTTIIRGELEMTVAGETQSCKPGDMILIPSNTPHSARAITACVVMDVFQPARDDYR